MDDRDIITLMFLSKSDAYLAMRLFKAKGYGKNKIKRLVYNELKHSWNNADVDIGLSSYYLSRFINGKCKHLIIDQLLHKFSSNYSISDVWKHLKIKFNKIR